MDEIIIAKHLHYKVMSIGVHGWPVAENRRKERKMEQCRGYGFSWPRSATLPLHSEGPTRSL